MLDLDDTIAAIATAQEGALRGIIRVSGPRAVETLEALFRPANEISRREPQRPYVAEGSVDAGAKLGYVPADVYVWPTARSYTRKPSFEIHTLGSPPILNAVLEAVRSRGCRLAKPGEFTLRAFLAGRLDLTQAEAVLGVIDAHDSRELEVALRQLAGGLTKPVSQLRDRLLDLLARLEAGLDFVEEDIEFISSNEIAAELTGIRDVVARLLDQMDRRTSSDAVARVVLVGWPNVGKSSLFNAMTAGLAIVSDQPGTTRDYVTGRVEVGGRTVVVIDTAGVQESLAATIDGSAQQFTAEQSQQATLRVLCLDGSRRMNDWERAQTLLAIDCEMLTVLTKADLPRVSDYAGESIDVSARSGSGIEELLDAINHRLQSPVLSEVCIGATANRCRESLRGALASIDAALEVALESDGDELIAAEIRLALDELGAIAGEVYTDDLLDRIFSRFCIGK